MTFAISISKFFFQKKFYAWNCLIRKDHRLFFQFAKIFWFFVVAPHQQIFEISEKVQFLQGHDELNIGNGTVIFSERPSFQKANKIINFAKSMPVECENSFKCAQVTKLKF